MSSPSWACRWCIEFSGDGSGVGEVVLDGEEVGTCTFMMIAFLSLDFGGLNTLWGIQEINGSIRSMV